jgi:putative transposase
VVAVKIVSSRNAVYQTAHHVVWCPKYRKAILTASIAKGLQEGLHAICTERDWRIWALEIQPDHVHLFVSLPPSVSVADAVKILKEITGRLLFKGYTAIKQRLWGGALWSPSYYVGGPLEMSVPRRSGATSNVRNISGGGVR